MFFLSSTFGDIGIDCIVSLIDSVMSSTLFSTTCYIKQKPYDLRICIDNDSNEYSVSTIDDILLTIDSGESTSNASNVLNSIRLHFESLSDKKKNPTLATDDDAIPEIIILSKLLNIKRTEQIPDESNSSSTSQRLEQFISQKIDKGHDVTLSGSTHVELSYVDISESFIWSVKQIQLEINLAAADQLCLIST